MTAYQQIIKAYVNDQSRQICSVGFLAMDGCPSKKLEVFPPTPPSFHPLLGEETNPQCGNITMHPQSSFNPAKFLSSGLTEMFVSNISYYKSLTRPTKKSSAY